MQALGPLSHCQLSMNQQVMMTMATITANPVSVTWRKLPRKSPVNVTQMGTRAWTISSQKM